MSFSALLKDFKAKPKPSADDAEHPAPKRAKAPAGVEEDDGAPEAGPVPRRDADPLPPLVFQIGMNKTGTSSICNLANACFGPGHCVHFTVGDGADGEVPIARRMVENERAGRSLLAGFDLARTRMFTDMEDMRPERGEGAVEGYRRFWRRLGSARRALIVGAGPGGIAAAGVFARSGYAVSWIDPSFDGGALSQYSSVPANTKVDLLQEQLQFFMPAVTRGCSPYRFGSSSAISVMCCIFTFTMALVRSFVTYSFCSSCDWYFRR